MASAAPLRMHPSLRAYCADRLPRKSATRTATVTLKPADGGKNAAEWALLKLGHGWPDCRIGIATEVFSVDRATIIFRKLRLLGTDLDKWRRPILKSQDQSISCRSRCG